MVARKWLHDGQPGSAPLDPHLEAVPLDASAMPPASLEDGFALLRRIQEMRRAQGPGYTGDLDALEALVWSMLFRAE